MSSVSAPIGVEVTQFCFAALVLPVHIYATVLMRRRKHLFPIRQRYPAIVLPWACLVPVGILLEVPLPMPIFWRYALQTTVMPVFVMLMAARAFSLLFQLEIEQDMFLQAQRTQFAAFAALPSDAGLSRHHPAQQRQQALLLQQQQQPQQPRWMPNFYTRNFNLLRPRYVLRFTLVYFLAILSLVLASLTIFPGDIGRTDYGPDTLRWQVRGVGPLSPANGAVRPVHSVRLCLCPVHPGRSVPRPASQQSFLAQCVRCCIAGLPGVHVHLRLVPADVRAGLHRVQAEQAPLGWLRHQTGPRLVLP